MLSHLLDKKSFSIRITAPATGRQRHPLAVWDEGIAPLGLIPENKIAEIRDRIDIIAVVSEHVPLRRAGVNHLGLCPFHAEKSPSFNVNAQKQFFYCFGCHKSGDVFRFLMDLEGRSFVEVAKDLARRAGVEIDETLDARESSEQQRRRLQNEDERAKLLRLHEIAAIYFGSRLKESPVALEYLDQRGIGQEVRERFRLGFAPEAWDGLSRLFEQRRVPPELVEKSGLCIRRQGQGHYDRFRNRIVFPLINANGDVVAFGGRIMPGLPATPNDDAKEVAKYINSPESPLYKKGDNLYGFHAAKDSARKSKQAILVEGNFDVLALHQHGVDNAMAPMGTALTDNQVRLLKRLLGSDGHVVLMLDGDRAGRSATLKDIWIFSQANLNDMALFTGSDIDVRVAQLPDGEDPDTYVARDRAGLLRRLKNAKPAVDYVLDEAIKLAEHGNVSGKAKVLMQVAPLLKAVRNPTTLAMYVDRLADSLAIDSNLVWRHIREEQRSAPAARIAPSPRPEGVGQAQQPVVRPAPGPALDSQVKALLSLIGDHPQLLPKLSAADLDLLADQGVADLLREAQDFVASGEVVNSHHLIEISPPEMRGEVALAVLAGKFTTSEHPEKALETIIERMRQRVVRQELEDLHRALAEAVEVGNNQRAQDLKVRIAQLTLQRQRLLPPNARGPE